MDNRRTYPSRQTDALDASSGGVTNVYVSPRGVGNGVPGMVGTPGMAAGAQQSTTRTVTEKKINWGKVAKGALIITGVVVAAVVGAAVLGYAASALLNTPTGAMLASGLVEGATETFHITKGLLGTAWTTGLGMTTNFLGGFGISTPAITPIPGVREAFTSAASWIGGLGAAAVAAPLAMSKLSGLQLVDQTAHQVTTTTPAGMGVDPSVHAQVATQKKSGLFGSTTMGIDTPDPTDLIDEHHAAQNSQKAAKMASHHAAESHHEHKTHLARQNLQQSMEATKSWRERVERPGSSPLTAQPRQARYTDQLSTEQELAALATPQANR